MLWGSAPFKIVSVWDGKVFLTPVKQKHKLLSLPGPPWKHSLSSSFEGTGKGWEDVCIFLIIYVKCHFSKFAVDLHVTAETVQDVRLFSICHSLPPPLGTGA